MKPTDQYDDGVAPTDAEYLHNDEVAHEHGDINVRAIVMFLVGLAVVTAVVMLLMGGTFVLLERMAAANDPQLSPLAAPSGGTPPGPVLLTNEPAELQKTRDAEAKALGGYGWVDEKTGVAHIPIDEAKKKLLERGVPARAGEPPDPRLGTHAPSFGESSGGRILGSPATEKGAIAPAPQPGAAPTHKGH